ncbi:MAG: recombinase family protein [Oscillospiraceae bacterium]
MSKITALYIRVSTDAQYEEGYSVDAQKEKLEQFCKLKDISNYQFFIDGGWSGSNIDRPEMKRMLTLIMSGQVESVIVYKLDRLSRSQRDTVYLLEDVFIPNNCNFISLNENFDTTTPYGKAMIGILSVFAQLERENIRERTRMGMYERVKSGFWMGGGRVPFGYDYDPEKNILVPNEHAEDVKKIYQLYIQGYSPFRISKMFDVCGECQIIKILARPTYKGMILYNGELIQGKHEPLVSEELWEKAQNEHKRRSVQRTIATNHLLAGVLYCGVCGAKLRYQRWGGGGMKLYCYSQQKSKPHLIKDPSCDNYRYNADEIEAVVLDSIFKYTDAIKISDDAQVHTSNVLQTLQDKYDTLSSKIKRLYNLYATNGDDLLLETINENKAQLEEVSQLLDKEEHTVAVVKDIRLQLENLCNLREAWPTLSQEDKQQAIRSCISRIELTKDKVDIKFRY